MSKTVIRLDAGAMKLLFEHGLNEEQILELKQSFLNEFSRKYLKEVINSEFMSSIKGSLLDFGKSVYETEIIKFFSEYAIPEKRWGVLEIKSLTEKARFIIHQKIEEEFNKLIEKKSKEYHEKSINLLYSYIDEHFEKMKPSLKAYIEATKDNIVIDEIKKKLDSLKG